MSNNVKNNPAITAENAAGAAEAAAQIGRASCRERV